MSRHRSARSRKATRPIILPTSVGGPSPEALVTGVQSKQIQDLIDLLRRNNLTELELEREGVRIRIRHEVAPKPVTVSTQETAPSVPQQTVQPAGTTSPSSEQSSALVTIVSPIVGTFYRSPSPDADPYVEEGDFVKKGQVLCIVEAMKLMNEIESEADGRIVKILAESTKSVEYGQALFLIDPNAAP